MGKNRVVPAVLTDDPSALERMVRQAEAFTGYVQIDIMDGEFVPSKSVRANDMARLHARLAWEAHLMVRRPEECLADFRKAGARKVVFHYEATASPREVIARARELGLGVGIAINPETPVLSLEPLAGLVDSVLFLSVVPGFYGSQFIPEVLGKITEFRRLTPGIPTGIDGGIKAANIKLAAGTGVDTVFVGSAIFISPDPAESFRQLNALVEGP